MCFSAEFERISQRIAETVLNSAVVVDLVGELNLPPFQLQAFFVMLMLSDGIIRVANTSTCLACPE